MLYLLTHGKCISLYCTMFLQTQKYVLFSQSFIKVRNLCFNGCMSKWGRWAMIGTWVSDLNDESLWQIESKSNDCRWSCEIMFFMIKLSWKFIDLSCNKFFDELLRIIDMSFSGLVIGLLVIVYWHHHHHHHGNFTVLTSILITHKL